MDVFEATRKEIEMNVSIVDMEVAVQQREWERALIERKNRMLRAAADPLVPLSLSARLVEFVWRNHAREASRAAA
jgi:hypothetical protein